MMNKINDQVMKNILITLLLLIGVYRVDAQVSKLNKFLEVNENNSHFRSNKFISKDLFNPQNSGVVEIDSLNIEESQEKLKDFKGVRLVEITTEKSNQKTLNELMKFVDNAKLESVYNFKQPSTNADFYITKYDDEVYEDSLVITREKMESYDLISIMIYLGKIPIPYIR